jgi:hypothetical protein
MANNTTHLHHHNKNKNAFSSLIFHESHANHDEGAPSSALAKDHSELTTVAVQSFFVCIIGGILFIALCFLFISRGRRYSLPR